MTVFACEVHPTVPATCYDTHADRVLCGDHCDEKSAHDSQFVLDHIPDRVHAAGRPTIELEEAA